MPRPDNLWKPCHNCNPYLAISLGIYAVVGITRMHGIDFVSNIIVCAPQGAIHRQLSHWLLYATRQLVDIRCTLLHWLYGIATGGGYGGGLYYRGTCCYCFFHCVIATLIKGLLRPFNDASTTSLSPLSGL